jgi:tetratricopeptide (TPR) repeat protein
LFRENNDLAHSFSDFSKSIAINPKNINALLARADVLYALEDLKQAKLDLDEAIKLNTNSVDAYKLRGIISFRLKQYEDAINDYNSVLKFESKETSIYYYRGLTYLEQGKYLNALTDFSEAIKKGFTTDKNIYYNRAVANYYLDELDNAIADLDIYLKTNQETHIFDLRGSIYYRQKKYEQAIADFTAAINLEPNDASSYHNRANSYRSLSRYNEAIADCRKFIEIAKNSAEYSNYISDVEKEIEFLEYKLSEDKK